MIQKEDIIKYLNKETELLDKEELRSVIELYPYCEILRWIYLRLLYQNNDITFEKELLNQGIYITNRKGLYFFLTDENKPEEESDNTIPTEQLISGMGDYFSKPEPTEAQRESLQLLAQKLKEARLKRKEEIEKREKEQKNEEEKTINRTPKRETTTKKHTVQRENNTLDINEENIKFVTNTINKLISEQKYLDALEILRSINLNNSKKSSYFALQIKYLETILKTTQK